MNYFYVSSPSLKLCHRIGLQISKRFVLQSLEGYNAKRFVTGGRAEQRTPTKNLGYFTRSRLNNLLKMMGGRVNLRN